MGGIYPKEGTNGMRMRKKPNLIPRMEACAPWQIRTPDELRGKWRDLMPVARELRVEVGCGKGKFTVETAQAEPDVLLIALELCPDAMVVGMERAKELDLKNVFFVDLNVSRIAEVFAPDEVDLIYINFCDPWPKSRNAKRRLTYHTFLEQYKTILRPGGQIHFKTDNAGLFAWSLEEFDRYGYTVQNVTDDLHQNGVVGVMTGYEEKFHAMGTPIHRCEIVIEK